MKVLLSLLATCALLSVGIVLFFMFGGYSYISPKTANIAQAQLATQACLAKRVQNDKLEAPYRTQIDVISSKLNAIGQIVSIAQPVPQGDLLNDARIYDESTHTTYYQTVINLNSQYIDLQNSINAIEQRNSCP